MPKIFYFRIDQPNFGDELNRYLWEKLAPGAFGGYVSTTQAATQGVSEDDTLFIGIGTLLNDWLPAAPRKLVFGAGFGYGREPPTPDERWHVYCVRGPLTAKALKLPPETAVTDPAVLVTEVVGEPPSQGPDWAFMPHHFSAMVAPWRKICEAAGMIYVDPAGPVDEIIAAIRGCKTLVAEAMHGVIVADAFRIPWVPVRCYPHILSFKWNDWCRSLGLDYAPLSIRHLPESQSEQRPGEAFRAYLKRMAKFSDAALAATRLRAVRRSAKPVLSSDRALRSAVARLKDRLDAFKNDQASGRWGDD